jgi:hypothetical protein
MALTTNGENPMKLLRVRGTSKRCREPIGVGVGKFRLLLDELQEPFPARWSFSISPHVSAASELFALQWRDVLWEERTLSCAEES